MFVQWPFLNGQGYTPGPDAMEEWSERVDECGYVHGPSLAALADENGMIHVDQIPKQQIKLLPPHRGQQHYLNGTSAWVGIDEPDNAPVVIPDPAEFAVHEQAIMVERLHYTGAIKDPEPEGPPVARELRPQFDPTGRTPSAVNAYIEACETMGNTAEMARVVAAEMMGAHRQQILKKWPGI
jgi:hypothetical protein